MDQSLEQHKELIDKLTDQEDGYFEWFITPNNKLGCLVRFIFTVAILENIDDIGYENRWCYGSLLEATVAKQDWIESKSEEPQNYIRRLMYNEPH